MLLIDGDVVCYRCAWSSQNDDAERAESTVKNFMYDLVTTAYAHLGVDDEDKMDFVVYLTGRNNFRKDIAVTAPYKGNRSDKPKPIHLDLMREHLVNNWDAIIADNEEADDRIAIDMANNPDAISVSIDKDFYQIPGRHYDMVKHTIKTVGEHEAILNLYKQILTGDRVDNIIGIKGIGPVKADKLLSKCKTEEEMFEVCRDEYGKTDMGLSRLIENARLLYLRRKVGEVWQPPTARSEEDTSEE